MPETAEILALRENARLREALGQFADPNNWGVTPWGFRWGGDADDPCQFARAVLDNLAKPSRPKPLQAGPPT
jgi:hypothetical protein